MRPRLLTAVLRRAEAAGTDADLLARYRADRDDAAFAELARRHGRLVWAVCRNLLASEADAEDAFQATFVALTRSAGRIRDGQAVAAWLHAAAVRVSLDARRSAARRHRREATAAATEANLPVAESRWEAVHAAVHEEVRHLPEAQRAAFVLCCLEGRGQTEAAAMLGWKLGTLSGRLTRAKRAVLARLDRRGVLPAAGLAVVATADPPAVARSGHSATVLELARGAAEGTMRAKLWAAAVLVGAAAATGGGVWLSHSPAQDVRPKVAAAPPAADLGRAKWEYTVVKVEARGVPAFTDRLQKLGQDGWELCGSEMLAPPPADLQVPHLVFKRPVQSASVPALTRPAPRGPTSLLPAVGPPQQPMKVQVIPLRTAQSAEVANVIREVYSGSPGFGPLAVSSDTSSNSLVLSATAEQTEAILALVARLEDARDRHDAETKKREEEQVRKERERLRKP